MASRLELHDELVKLLGSRNVYYQPPSSVKMTYPCIIYDLSDVMVDYADNKPYWFKPRYTITVVDRDPESEIAKKMIPSFDYCSFDRKFISDNLNHFVFTLYY